MSSYGYGEQNVLNEKDSRHGGLKLRWQNYSEKSHLRARILGVFLTLFVAFVLALLCVFAGKRPGYIESADLFTVNTSTLGHLDLKSALPSLPSIPSLTEKRGVLSPAESAVASAETAANNAVPTAVHTVAAAVASKAHSAGGAIVSQVNSAEGALSTAVNSVETAAQNALNGAVDGLAKKLGIHQFYSVHVMNWCEGYYTPGYIANATNVPTKNVTECSGAKPNQTFDLTDTVGHELIPGITLSDLHWPDALATGFRALRMAINVMFVLYVVGIAWLGLGLLGVLIACVREHNRTHALWNMIIAWFGFVSLVLASAVSTGLASKATDLVNKHGHDIGLSASRGNQFQGMTWSATILTFIAAVIWTDVFTKRLQETVIWHVDTNRSERTGQRGKRGQRNERGQQDGRGRSAEYQEDDEDYEYVEKSARASDDESEGRVSMQSSRHSAETHISMQSSRHSEESHVSVESTRRSEESEASMEPSRHSEESEASMEPSRRSEDSQASVQSGSQSHESQAPSERDDASSEPRVSEEPNRSSQDTLVGAHVERV